MKTIKTLLSYTLAALVILVMAAWVLPALINWAFTVLLHMFNHPISSLLVSIGFIGALVIADRRKNK